MVSFRTGNRSTSQITNQQNALSAPALAPPVSPHAVENRQFFANKDNRFDFWATFFLISQIAAKPLATPSYHWILAVVESMIMAYAAPCFASPYAHVLIFFLYGVLGVVGLALREQTS